MNKDQKLLLLLEGQREGVSAVCLRYGISRTLYYRWLKRYTESGVDGLDVKKPQRHPPNKTEESVVEVLKALIKKEPHWGPRALKYRLDDLGYKISESAVYNILQRLGLTLRDARLRYARQRRSIIPATEKSDNVPPLQELQSGEGWLFWTVPISQSNAVGPLYVYTFMDVVSKIACSRLYSTLSITHFENLLSGVALPVAASLNLNTKYLYLSMEDSFFIKKREAQRLGIEQVLQGCGFEVQAGVAPEGVQVLKQAYNRLCLGDLMPVLKAGEGPEALKVHLQRWMRNYNLHHLSLYDGELDTPVNYHAKAMGTELILPLWAYLDRNY